MSAIVQNAIIISGAATYEAAVAALAVHFGGAPLNLATGEADVTPLRDATAVFTGTSQVSVSTGATPETAQPTVERDIAGLPWDERIHSSSKTKNADGSWRGRKGVAPGVIVKVKAELLGNAAASGATAVDSAPATPAGNGDDTARQARIDYAKEVAFATVGPQPCDDMTFDKLQRGVLVEVAPFVSEYFTKWQTAMNNAYMAYVPGAGAVAAPQTAHVGLQAINPESATNPAVQVSAAAAPVQPAAPAADTFAGFAAHYAAHLANPAFGEVLATLGITGGFPALATAEAMIPAVRALLTAKGIV